MRVEPGSISQMEHGSRLVHPEDQQALQEPCRGRAARAEPVNAEFRVLHPNGSTVWLQASGQLAEDPSTGDCIMAGSVFDITERKSAERKVADTVRKLENAKRAPEDQPNRMVKLAD